MAKKILVIDDEELLTKTFTILLSKFGYEVYVAKNGQDAEIISEAEQFDLIICDMRMPGMNGVETIKSIRKKSLAVDIPVIFITGFADPKVEVEAKALNPVAYLYKPFDHAEVLKLIKTRLGK